MPTSVISSTITDLSGTPVEGARVVARLVPSPAFRISDASELAPIEETLTNGAGQWALTLEETSNISPAGSYYEVVEYLPGYSSPRRHMIQVGAADQSLQASLVSPAPVPAGAVYLDQAAADARYQQLGGGFGAVQSVGTANNNGVSGSAARADHVHDISNGAIDALALFVASLRPVTICTSGTRPGAPALGDPIFETDTDLSLYWNGTAWVPRGQAARSWTFISEVVLGGAGAISFQNIPQTFTDLRLEGIVRGSPAAAANYMVMRFNNDATAIYDSENLRGEPGANGDFVDAGTSARVGFVPNGNNAANIFGAIELFIPDYKGTSHWKSWMASTQVYQAGTIGRRDAGGGHWRSTAAITRIDLSSNNAFTNNFAAASRVALLGRR